MAEAFNGGLPCLHAAWKEEYISPNLSRLMQGLIYVVVCSVGEKGWHLSARGMSTPQANMSMTVLASSTSLRLSDWTEKSAEAKLRTLPNPLPP